MAKRKSKVAGAWWERGNEGWSPRSKVWCLNTPDWALGAVFKVKAEWVYMLYIRKGGAKAAGAFKRMAEAMSALEKEVGK